MKEKTQLFFIKNGVNLLKIELNFTLNKNDKLKHHIKKSHKYNVLKF